MSTNKISDWEPNKVYHKRDIVRFLSKLRVCIANESINVLPISEESLLIDSVILVSTQNIINNIKNTYLGKGIIVTANGGNDSPLEWRDL